MVGISCISFVSFWETRQRSVHVEALQRCSGEFARYHRRQLTQALQSKRSESRPRLKFGVTGSWTDLVHGGCSGRQLSETLGVLSTA